MTMNPIGYHSLCGTKADVPLGIYEIVLSEACALRKAFELEGYMESRKGPRNGNIMVWGLVSVRILHGRNGVLSLGLSVSISISPDYSVEVGA